MLVIDSDENSSNVIFEDKLKYFVEKFKIPFGDLKSIDGNNFERLERLFTPSLGK